MWRLYRLITYHRRSCASNIPHNFATLFCSPSLSDSMLFLLAIFLSVFERARTVQSTLFNFGIRLKSIFLSPKSASVLLGQESSCPLRSSISALKSSSSAAGSGRSFLNFLNSFVLGGIRFALLRHFLILMHVSVPCPRYDLRLV